MNFYSNIVGRTSSYAKSSLKSIEEKSPNEIQTQTLLIQSRRSSTCVLDAGLRATNDSLYSSR